MFYSAVSHCLNKNIFTLKMTYELTSSVSSPQEFIGHWSTLHKMDNLAKQTQYIRLGNQCLTVLTMQDKLLNIDLPVFKRHIHTHQKNTRDKIHALDTQQNKGIYSTR